MKFEKNNEDLDSINLIWLPVSSSIRLFIFYILNNNEDGYPFITLQHPIDRLPYPLWLGHQKDEKSMKEHSLGIDSEIGCFFSAVFHRDI
jgi:hypothetical protein